VTAQIIDGKYELVELAGEGGMATVYKGIVRGAAGFSRTVAVKKIKNEFRAIRNYIDMFVEEARVGSDLAHPNIVQVYDFCTDDEGAYYLIMEWVEGLDLGTFIKSYRELGQSTPWPLIVAVGIGSLRGLGAAHERQREDGTVAPVIHRDVSPHNILLGANGVVKLTDFGLARARDRVYSLTAPGTVKGKLSYLSPEVSLGKQATPQSDLFGMGTVLWEALSGMRLFDARTDLEVFKQIRNCEIRPLGRLRPDVPVELVAAIEQALKKDPNDRYASARQMAFALAEILKGATQTSDAQQLLGASVIEAKKRLAAKLPKGKVTTDTVPTWIGEMDKKVTLPPRASVPGVAPRPATPPVPAPVVPAPSPTALGDAIDGALDGSVDVEFSAPDLSVDPLPLTTRKKP
jgi:serine/threonine-protein kinase